MWIAKPTYENENLPMKTKIKSQLKMKSKEKARKLTYEISELMKRRNTRTCKKNKNRQLIFKCQNEFQSITYEKI